jgi:hypothetical protein
MEDEPNGVKPTGLIFDATVPTTFKQKRDAKKRKKWKKRRVELHDAEAALFSERVNWAWQIIKPNR